METDAFLWDWFDQERHLTRVLDFVDRLEMEKLEDDGGKSCLGWCRCGWWLVLGVRANMLRERYAQALHLLDNLLGSTTTATDIHGPCPIQHTVEMARRLVPLPTMHEPRDSSNRVLFQQWKRECETFLRIAAKNAKMVDRNCGWRVEDPGAYPPTSAWLYRLMAIDVYPVPRFSRDSHGTFHLRVVLALRNEMGLWRRADASPPSTVQVVRTSGNHVPTDFKSTVREDGRMLVDIPIVEQEHQHLLLVLRARISDGSLAPWHIPCQLQITISPTTPTAPTTPTTPKAPTTPTTPTTPWQVHEWNSYLSLPPILVKENRADSIPGKVWDAAYVLVHVWRQLLVATKQEQRSITNHRHLLDLSSGTGMLGIALGAFTQLPVTITDLEECLPLIRENLLLNRVSVNAETTVHRLAWGSHQDVDALPAEVDCILAADLVYAAETRQLLLDTLHELARHSSTGRCTLWLAYKQRALTAEEELEIQTGLVDRGFVLQSLDASMDRILLADVRVFVYQYDCTL